MRSVVRLCLRVVLFSCVLWVWVGCVIAPPPLLQGVRCESDEDCTYGTRCCPRGNGQGKLCYPGCKDCIPGDTRACYDASKEAFRGKGLCKEGSQTCKADGTWDTACQGAVLPAREVCDGQDNDCDGRTDEELASCECTKVGETRSCFSGDPKQAGVGPCKAGAQTCLSSHAWGPCQGEVAPKKEDCNGEDDDCDGKVDQELKKACKGDCGDGEILCVDGKWGPCSAESAPEECDGKDNDCDGKVDNVKGGDKPLSKECYAGANGTKGVGLCKAGELVCEQGKWSTCQGQIIPQPKDCTNQKDNNCDGKVDSDCTCPTTCKVDIDCGVAACGGKIFCVSGKCAAQCTSGCLSDDDCDTPSCGKRVNCIAGECSLHECPSSCDRDFDCQVNACQAKKECRQGKCQLPVCPASCSISKSCQDADCGTKSACVKGKCEEPCKADPKWNTACSAGEGVCGAQGTYQCSADGKTVECSAKEDLSKKQAQDICGNNKDDDCDGFADEGCGITNKSWAFSMGSSSSSDTVEDMTVDKDGNVYIVGTYYTKGFFSQLTVSARGGREIFVVKIDPSGLFLWVATAGSSSTDYGRGVAVDKNGNVYVTGLCSTSCYFGTHRITSRGSYDAFVAKLDKDGKWQWAVSAGGSSIDEAQKVAVDSTGSAYITGFFQGTAYFNGKQYISAGNKDLFIMKVNTSGVFQWVATGGGPGVEAGLGISVDSKDNVYVSGNAEPGAKIGPKTFTKTFGSFTASLDSTGKFRWVIAPGGLTMTTDDAGNTFGTGRFWGTFSYGAHQISSIDGQPGGDAFVVKINNSGAYVWASTAGGNASDIGLALAPDNLGNVFMIGYYASPTLKAGTITLTNKGANDVFVAKLNSSGQFTWATSLGTISSEYGHAIAVDVKGNVYAAGRFSRDLMIGPTTLKTRGGSDVFVWKILKP